MEPAARERAERLAGRVWCRTSPVTRPAVRATVEEGLAQGRVLALTYRDRLGRLSQRRAESHLLAHTDHKRFLIGWCQTRQAPCWFRFDRINSAKLTTEPVAGRDPALFGTPPPDAPLVR